MIERALVIIAAALAFITAPGCKHRKKTQAPQPAAVADSLEAKCRLDYKSARTLARRMKENEFQFTWLSAKAEVETRIEEKDENFDIRIAIKRDSAMLVSIQYLLGVQVAKVLVTRDTVVFVNYVGKTYFKGDFSYLNQLLDTELDFDLLQAVLFGNSAEYHDEETRLKPVADRENCLYLLSTERKRRLRRIQSGSSGPRDALQVLTLRPDYKIIRNEFIDPSTSRRFVAAYSGFAEKDSVYAPFHVDIDIFAEKKAQVKIDYVRIERNTALKLSLNVPAKYDPIQLQKKEK